MSGPQSQISVSKLYQSVIDDVMTGVRDSFLDEGVDEQLLQELRMLWESKLGVSKAIELETSTNTAPSAPVNNGNNNGNHQPTSASAPSASTSQPPSQPIIPQDPSALVPIQITMPRQPNDPAGPQRSITIQVPASCIQTNKLQEILSLPMIQATLSMSSELAASTLQNQVNLALNKEGIATVSTPASVITTQQQLLQKQQNFRSKGVVQLDGAAGGDSSDEDDDDDDDDDDDLDDDVDENDPEQNDEQDEGEGQDEEPLNSEDDVSDAEDSIDKLYEIDNVVVCQYDKITRARNKWKFHLKDGIMNLNGKDYVFQKCNGDAEW